MGQARQFEMTVLTGLNAGVELTVNAGRHSIGGADTDDIQLDGLSDTLADISLEHGAIKIKPHIASMTSKPGGALPQNRVSVLKLPARISLTPEIDIFTDCAEAAAPKRQLLKPLLAVAAVLIGALALTAVQIDFEFGATKATASSPDVASVIRPDPRASKQIAQVTTPAGEACTHCATDAANDLRQSLATAGILGLVVTAGDGAVRVEGGLSTENRAKWSGIRSNFDGKWSMVPLLSSFSEAKNGAPLSVASVWLGEPREIRTDAGVTMTIGDVVSDGWTLSAIEQDFVELIQGETKLRVNF